MHLNKYYGELTGFYWIWKNKINDLNEDDFIGFCHYRKLWMNYRNEKKNKYSKNSIFKDLLTTDNKIFDKVDVLQVQPIIFEDRNLLEDFQIIHKSDVLEKSLQFLEEPLKSNFEQYPQRKQVVSIKYVHCKKICFYKILQYNFSLVGKMYELLC